MTVLMGNYEFDGPYKSAVELEEQPGLFAILHCEGDVYELIHLAESDNVRGRIEVSPITVHSSTESIVIIVLYTQAASSRDRKKMVVEIQSEFESDSERTDPSASQLESESNEFDLVQATRL
jgi:hypothetical protein